ncbi:MAG: stage 0 sporulation protein [Limnochordales bacterium]|nr:stage 0 sporulation protein [Limnochordales bacterium]
MQESVAQKELRTVVGVRLPKSARIYYFDPRDLALERRMRVLVATEHGQVWGEVVVPPRLVPVADIPQPLQPVIRVWRPEDADELERLKAREREARAFCQERIEARGLPMRLVDVEWTFDGGKVTFYFVAEGRVDFRELVYDLASRYHCRVELRQIGVRDHARLVGGYGPCGRPLCCATFLREFAPVAIRMAKEQNLSLNPGRISGMCGRLMCCLRYEDDSEGNCLAKDDGQDQELLSDERSEINETNETNKLIEATTTAEADDGDAGRCHVEAAVAHDSDAGSEPGEGNRVTTIDLPPPQEADDSGAESGKTPSPARGEERQRRSRKRRSAPACPEARQVSKGKGRGHRRGRQPERHRRARPRKDSHPDGQARAAEAG